MDVSEECQTALEQLRNHLETWSQKELDLSNPFKKVDIELDQENIQIDLVLKISRHPKLRLRLDQGKFASITTDIFAMTQVTEPLKMVLEREFCKDFYNSNYETLSTYLLDSSERVNLASKFAQICRFCKKGHPEVTFHNEAHAVPASLGNQRLFSKYECDACNAFFGNGIEFQLGNWSHTQRTLGFVEGRNGVPALESKEGWKIQPVDGGFEIKVGTTGLALELNEIEKSVTMKVPKRPYTPVAVMKAFNKIAISLMPEIEVDNFKSTIEWLLEKDHTKPPKDAMFLSQCLTACYPGPEPFSPGHVVLLKRKNDDKSLPYMTFVLAFANTSYQIFVPTSIDLQNPTITVKPFSYSYEHSSYGPPKRTWYDWCGSKTVENDRDEVRLAISGPINSIGKRDVNRCQSNSVDD